MFESSEKQTYFHVAMPAEKLLNNAFFSDLLAKISQFSGLKDRHYDVLYHKLIHDFAEFVQAVPIRAKGRSGTLLAYSIERASQALEKYAKENPKNFDIRYAYALFTAALFQDIGKMMGQQKIMLCDSEGRYLEDWLPSTGPMPADNYYRLWFLGEKWISVSKLSTLLLARQIMSPVGFNWIAEELPVYKMWLEALSGDEQGETNKLRNFLALIKPPDETTITGRGATLILKPQHPTATKDGEAFLEWLIQGINDGTIPVNTVKAPVYVMPTGELFLVCPQLIDMFCQKYPGHSNWEDVCRQFNELGLTSAPGEKVKFDRFLIQQAQLAETISNANSISHLFARRNHAEAAGVKTASPPGSLNMNQMMREGLVLIQPPRALDEKVASFAKIWQFKAANEENTVQERPQKQLDALLSREVVGKTYGK